MPVLIVSWGSNGRAALRLSSKKFCFLPFPFFFFESGNASDFFLGHISLSVFPFYFLRKYHTRDATSFSFIVYFFHLGEILDMLRGVPSI